VQVHQTHRHLTTEVESPADPFHVIVRVMQVRPRVVGDDRGRRADHVVDRLPLGPGCPAQGGEVWPDAVQPRKVVGRRVLEHVALQRISLLRELLDHGQP
jgi:hypothetical protein